jgi:uncharacterized protein
MQQLGDGSWVISASDLTVFAGCPWRLARVVDAKLGKGIVVPELDDPMMELVARLGGEHEKRQLAALKTQMPVIELEYSSLPPSDAPVWRANIQQARQETLDALSSLGSAPSSRGAVFQATLYEEVLPDAPLPVGFQGFADFVVFSDGLWEVWDSKLARRAKDPALIQLGAYVDQLARNGVPLAPTVRLVLGDGNHSIHAIEDLIDPYISMRNEVIKLLAARVGDPLPLPWGDDTWAACGTKGCPACHEQIVAHDDLFQIAGVRKTQRQKIMTGGFSTMTEFASASTEEVNAAISGIGVDTLVDLHLQAQLQVESNATPWNRPVWRMLSRSVIENLPQPSPGDIFFDFEGDPTFQEFSEEGNPRRSPTGAEDVWFGIEYLFGLWGTDIHPAGPDTSFLPLWAESFDQEKEVFESFLTIIHTRLENFPDLHVYHYAPYERTRLKAMAQRHKISSPVLDELLERRLIDLYPVVKKGLKIGLPSYGLKALESLYFDPKTRTGIAGGGESVVAFSDYLVALANGNLDVGSELRDSILHYNRIDCLSTEALRNWLLSTLAEA